MGDRFPWVFPDLCPILSLQEPALRISKQSQGISLLNLNILLRCLRSAGFSASYFSQERDQTWEMQSTWESLFFFTDQRKDPDY